MAQERGNQNAWQLVNIYLACLMYDCALPEGGNRGQFCSLMSQHQHRAQHTVSIR